MALTSQTASASFPSSFESSSSPRWKHDVFLSFRGVDTRRGIVTDLYHELQNRGIKTYMDDQDLVIGTPISPSLLVAIEESRFAVVVLSRNYASSPWCLEELTKIVQCMDDQVRILPIFYDVEPSDVRHQKKSYEVAFIELEEDSRHDTEKVNQWRGALKEVANLSGWDSKKYKSDRELVKDIVESVCSKLRPIEYEFAMCTGDFQAFEATRQAMDEVMKALKDDQVTAIGVYGMGGVGKTTMVKHVGEQAQKSGIFNQVIMAVVSQSPDLRKIQGALADLLGVKLEEETEIGRAARLNKEIMRKNNILIILDDIWEVLDLSRTGIPSYDKLKKYNSKVLLTTRIWNVCHVMKCQEKITLDVLSKQDSWTLFVRNAGVPFESSTFEDVARRVAGECCGLPIALIAVAKALGDKDLVEWERAARRLERSQTANPDDKGDAFECIKLSYDYLKNEDSKTCFLLCCLFPEDYDIPIEELFKYAIGKGLFRDADTIEEARETADSMVKYLKNCSLLFESERYRCVRMHDVIRDTAMNIAKFEDGLGFLVKAGSGLKDWSCRLHEDYSAISLMENQIRKLPEELVCPKLQILLLQKNYDLNQISEKIFQSRNELRVLDLSFTGISLLPPSFSLLTNLQALYLDSCKSIIHISILGKLKKLHILSMRGYPLEKLSREIRHLTNLRMLDVSGQRPVGTGIVTIPSKVISKLHRLEELYMWDYRFEHRLEELYMWSYRFELWGGKVEGKGEETNIGFDELTGLSNLKILQVCICDAKCIPKYVEVEPNWVYFDIYIGRFNPEEYNVYERYSRSLQLVETTMSTLPDWFVNVVTKKTEVLAYKIGRYELINFVMEYDRGRLHALKHLFIFGPNEMLEVLINTTTRVIKEPLFENLKELHLIDLNWLKVLGIGELPLGSLINLKALNVRYCGSLENVLLPSKLLQRLQNLQRVYLTGLREVDYVFGCEGFEPQHSKLRKMTLGQLHSLRSICNGPAPRAIFQTLKSLFINCCESLESLFTFDVAQCLFQLEDLWVVQCCLLERVIEASKETANNKKTVLPKLKKLVLVDLPMLYNVDIECPSLEHLLLDGCPRFSFSTSAFDYYFGSRNRIQLDDPHHSFEYLYHIMTMNLRPGFCKYTNLEGNRSRYG